MNKKGFGAYAQLALVIFMIIIVLTLVPAVKATVLEVISAFV